MNIGRIVDLSMPIGPATVVYPGDPVPSLSPATTIEHDGYHVMHVRMGSHTGTHVDAPYHFDAAGPRIDELDLRLFTGPGVVVDATRLAPRTPIDWHVLAPYAGQLRPGVIVLLRTGGSGHGATSAYLDHPFLDAGACRRLLDLGVRTVCTDALNIDETPGPGHPGEGYPVHHLIAEVGGVIGENFCNLNLIDFADPFISCLPIAIQGGDGAPTRAVAMELRP
ncbi:MAG TPA: cyclase family protein [Jiangellales bacterium]|nr:cyclase family protein [Jiangellales bacterium]